MTLDLEQLCGHKLLQNVCQDVNECATTAALRISVSHRSVLSQHTYLSVASCDCVESLGLFFHATETRRGKVSLVICDNTRVNGCDGAWEILLL